MDELTRRCRSIELRGGRPPCTRRWMDRPWGGREGEAGMFSKDFLEPSTRQRSIRSDEIDRNMHARASEFGSGRPWLARASWQFKKACGEHGRDLDLDRRRERKVEDGGGGWWRTAGLGGRGRGRINRADARRRRRRKNQPTNQPKGMNFHLRRPHAPKWVWWGRQRHTVRYNFHTTTLQVHPRPTGHCQWGRQSFSRGPHHNDSTTR